MKDQGNTQFGFRSGIATTDAVFTVRLMQEKHGNP